MRTFFKKQYFVLCIGLLGFSQWSYAQEQLVPLSGNDAVKRAHKQLPKQQKSTQVIYYEPICLPFVDDFSHYTGYPDTTWWIGRQAYVNQSFAVEPPTIGCVTLDAVNERGFVYEHAKTSPFPADTLLSRPIRLDSIFAPEAKPLSAADSIYLSFFYQPGGGAENKPWNKIGDAPETEDSLLLEFGYQTGNQVLLYYITVFQLAGDTLRPGDTVYSNCHSNLYIIVEDYYFPEDILEVPCDSVIGMETIWNSVWADEGRRLDDFIQKYGTHFRQVMIPITNPVYFNSGFQFRFRNYASMELDDKTNVWGSNVDFWNIDYVRLNLGRSLADTAIDDVAFMNNPGSLLKKYTAMPWNQFKGFEDKEVIDTFHNYLTNLSNEVKNTSYRYEILDENTNIICSYHGLTQNLSPFHPTGYQTESAHATPTLKPINYPVGSSDSVVLLVQHIFRQEANGDKNANNDTVRYEQKFYNYYAYDDGTPESGYVVTSSYNPYKKSLALGFTPNKPDTLRAIDIYLNHTMNDVAFLNFTLTVWGDTIVDVTYKDKDGHTKTEKRNMPGSVKGNPQEVSQDFCTEIYGFQRFYLNEPIVIFGRFYIGYQISGANNRLNIGFDQNTNASENTFWRTYGNWEGSFMVGTPMLRPVLGAYFPQVEIVEPTANLDVKLYPNPANDKLHLILPEETQEQDITVSIYSLTGQKIYEQPYRSEVSLSNFISGFYVLHLTDTKSGMKAVRKFSIVK